MKGGELAEVMAAAMDRFMSARDRSIGLDKAIKKIMDANGHFIGKDVNR